MGYLTDSLFFRKGEGGVLEVTLWLCLSALIILLTMNYFFWSPEYQAEKTKLTNMSCKDLGQWLIDNSSRNIGRDGDANYVYAQAEYLVCTHSGASK